MRILVRHRCRGFAFALTALPPSAHINMQFILPQSNCCCQKQFLCANHGKSAPCALLCTIWAERVVANRPYERADDRWSPLRLRAYPCIVFQPLFRIAWAPSQARNGRQCFHLYTGNCNKKCDVNIFSTHSQDGFLCYRLLKFEPGTSIMLHEGAFIGDRDHSALVRFCERATGKTKYPS